MYYAQIGEHLFQKHQYGILNIPGYPAIIQPPVFPTLIAAMRYVVPRTLAGRLVSVVLGSLLIVFSFLIARRLFGSRSGWYAAVLTAIHPFLLRYSVKFLSEMTFLFFAVAGFYFFLRYWQKGTSRDVLWASLAAGLAYLTRMEGILIFVVLGAGILIQSFRKKNVVDTAIFLSIAVAVIVGYAAWTSAHLGSWVWIPKMKFTATHKLIFQQKAAEDPQFLVESEEIRQRKVYYALDSTNTQILAYVLFNQVVKNQSPAVRREVNVNRKRLLPQLVRQNVYNILWLFYRRSVVPLALGIFLLIGIAAGIRKKAVYSAHLMILAWAVPFSYFLISHVEPRFLIGWGYLSIFWIARGFAVVEERVATSRWRIPGANYMLIFILIFAVLPDMRNRIQSLKNESRLYQVTRALSTIIPPGEKVITSRPMHAFYNNWILFRLPWVDSLQPLSQYIGKNAITYLMIESPRDTRYNVVYRHLFQLEKALPGIDTTGVIDVPGYATRWFHVEK